jgi:hypothetical protein
VLLFMIKTRPFNHFSTSISMSGRKHTHNENLPVTPQNKSFTFVDGFAPKKPRLSVKNARQFTSQEIHNIQRDRKAQRLTQAREKEELVAKKKEELDVEQLRVVWQSIRGAGFKSLYDYLHTLFNTRDPVLSAQVSQMLLYHGPELLNSIHACHPDMAIDWALSTSAEHIEAEWKVLVREFQSAQGALITDILVRFSLQWVLAPSLYDLLQRVSGSHQSTSIYKDCNLVSSHSKIDSYENASTYHCRQWRLQFACSSNHATTMPLSSK